MLFFAIILLVLATLCFVLLFQSYSEYRDPEVIGVSILTSVGWITGYLAVYLLKYLIK